ncbi:MAG: hypothetical protein H0W74_08110 [Sphingosinicella sp.]|nr:hypothetical protein [Sphingosinicella sp.]
MTRKILDHQGRARGLYDEQLQREQQERRLFRENARNRAAQTIKEPARADG